MSKHCDGIFRPLRVCESFEVRITWSGPRWRMNLQKQRPVIFILRRISTAKQCKKSAQNTEHLKAMYRIQQRRKKKMNKNKLQLFYANGCLNAI